MKVSCNFLPSEFQAFQLDTRMMALSIVLWLASVGLWITFLNRERVKLKKSTELVTLDRANLQSVENAIRLQTYPQDRIKRLMEKFKFIRTAMGEAPKPYLRFYMSLEDAIPASTVGGPGVYIVSVKLRGDNTYDLEGEARTWRDALVFEENMNRSTFSNGKRNFSSAKLIKSAAVPRTDAYRFSMEFTFDPFN